MRELLGNYKNTDGGSKGNNGEDNSLVESVSDGENSSEPESPQKTNEALRKRTVGPSNTRKDWITEKKRCKNGHNCRFLKNSRCQYYHPEEHHKLISANNNHPSSQTSNALKEKRKNPEQQDEKDRYGEEEDCKNGDRCRFLKSSQCWFYHPESHYRKLTRDKNHKKREEMVQDVDEDSGRIDRIDRTRSKKSPSADGKLAAIEEEEHNQKNWVAGMQQSMHSLVQQVDKLTKEMIWLQKEQKITGRK